jgi:hypothetical protein
MLHGLDENPAPDKYEIAMPIEQGLHKLLDLSGGRHRRGLTSVTMIRRVPGQKY